MWLAVGWLMWTASQLWRVTGLSSARLLAFGCGVLLASGTIAVPRALASPASWMEGDQVGAIFVMFARPGQIGFLQHLRRVNSGFVKGQLAVASHVIMYRFAAGRFSEQGK